MAMTPLTFQGRKPCIPATCPLGSMIDAYLARTHYSQSDLARRIGVSHSIVSLWRRGERIPSRRNVPRIAKALETSQVRVMQAIQDGEQR